MESSEKKSHGISVEEVGKSLQRFGFADYMMFVIMLVMCSLIGIFFGYKDHQKAKNNKLKERRGSAAKDYLMGGKDMKVFPVAMSLVARWKSTLITYNDKNYFNKFSQLYIRNKFVGSFHRSLSLWHSI